MPYAATIPIWLNFDSLILDTATKIALTRIVASGIALDHVPDGMRLRTCTQRYMPGAAVLVIPDEILLMQRDAEESGELIVRPPCVDLDVLHEWACMISEEDPAAFALIPDMDLSAIWEAAHTWRELRGMDDALRPYQRGGSNVMPRYLATIPTYGFFNLILDDATSATITRIIARALARDRMPIGMTLQMSTASFVGQGAYAPEVIVAMQRKAEATGEPRTRLHPDDLVIIRQWAFDLKHEDPAAFAKLARMEFVAVWMAALPHWDALIAAEEKAEADRLSMLPAHLAGCPIVHTYADGWRWVHVTGADALVAEGNAMGHCVGNGLYVTLTGSRAVLSLRDPEGMPHVTASMCGDHLMMAKGRSNSTPTNYWAQVNDMVAHVGAYLQTHAVMGWADSDLAATVRAAKAERVAAQAEAAAAKLLADEAAGLMPGPPVDIATWSAANGLLGDGVGELPAFTVGRWRPVSVRIDPVPADPEAMIRTQPSHGDYAGQAAAREATRSETVRLDYSNVKNSQDIRNRVVALLDDPVILAEVQAAAAAGQERMNLGGAVVMPHPILAEYAAQRTLRGIPFMWDEVSTEDWREAAPRVGDEGIHGVYAGQGTKGGGIPCWGAHAYDPSAPSPDTGAPKP